MTPQPSQIFAPEALAGRVVLVTGGGTNLGKQAAIELAAAGAQVVIAGRREEVIEEAAAEIGERCSCVAGDIREPADATRIVETVRQRHGRLDVLVNNAGGQYFVPAEEIAAKGWRAVRRLNVGGTYTMIRAAVGAGFGDDGGTVVNVTVSPHHGMPAMAHTGAARAAVEQLTRELAAEWAQRRIAVVAAAIGRFDTESLRKYPEVVWRARPEASRCSASARCRSSAGSSRCWRARSAARSADRSSPSTAPPTTGSAPGRRRP